MEKKPKIFIGSSVESLQIAYAIQIQLEYTTEPTIWTQGVFNLTSNAFDDLIEMIKNVDFAIFVFTPDDEIRMRGETYKSIRDNLLYEFGLSVGILGKERVFAIIPRTTESSYIPSDLKGVTFAAYDSSRSDSNIQAALGPSVFQIQSQIQKMKEKVDKQIPIKVIKEFDFSGNASGEAIEIIAEHPYDYPPKVTLIDDAGVEFSAGIRHHDKKVMVSGYFSGLKGKIILYG